MDVYVIVWVDKEIEETGTLNPHRTLAGAKQECQNDADRIYEGETNIVWIQAGTRWVAYVEEVEMEYTIFELELGN